MRTKQKRRSMSNQPEENNLKKFGVPFQGKCISALVTDRVFLERILDIVTPDFFETDAHKWIIKLLSEYFPKYKEVPSKDVFLSQIQSISDVVLKASVAEQLSKVYKNDLMADAAYVKDTFLEFCKNQKLKNAIYEAGNLLSRADYEGIWKLINDASQAGIERNIGHDYMAEFDARMSEAAREVIKTGWAIIDGHLDGGLGKGELGFVVAPAGSGKSWILTRMGVEAMRQGKNVMHFTMELNEKYVGRRYDSCFSEIAFQEVRNFPDRIKDKLKDVTGKLYIKYYPMGTASSLTLKAHIERVQLLTGNKIDMVIVDYADLLRPFIINKNSNSYENGGDIYGELRGMAGELQVPVWSASQANRAAHEDNTVNATNVADSYKKIMIGDFIMSLSRNSADKRALTARVAILKSRMGSDGPQYPTDFDASCGKIHIYDEKSVEGMEVKNRTKTAEQELKDTLGKAWNKVHGSPGDDGQS